MKRIAALAFVAGALAAPATAETQLGEIVVSEHAAPPKGSITLQASGLPAATTTIGREEIERTNVGGDYSDLLRRVPGINAYSFGQGDIGSPVKMRGFTGTGAHGGDVAIYVDGVPQNFPSANQGGPGMSDLSWLTADMIERIEVVKGPFSALYGDQNRAGAINIITRRSGDSSVGASIGSYGRKRGNAVYSSTREGLSTFVAGEIHESHGYRDNSEAARANLFVKATLRQGDTDWALRGHYYRADWNAPGYLNYADLMAGTVKPSDRQPNVAPLWGNAERFGLVLTRTPATGEAGLHATAYAEHYDKSRANGVTGNLNAYNVQSDHRWIAGGRILYNALLSPRASLAVGGELRHDKGSGINQRWNSRNAPDSTYNNYWDLDLLTYGLFAQGQYRLVDSVKLIGGLRTDFFDYRIDNRLRPAASINYDKSVATPRVGIVWSPVATLDIFANLGEGFRSPAERELSPTGGGTPLALGQAGGTPFPDLKPPKVKARDIGFNAVLGQRWKLSASRYHTLNQNEIRETTPGSGVYAGIGDTTRSGWEIEANFFATDALAFYGSVGKVKGRIANPATAGQNLISGLPEDTYRLGFEYTAPLAGGRLLTNGDAFHISGAPYYSGGSLLFSRPYSRYDLRVSFEQGPWRYTVHGTFQPREYASEQAGTTVDPRPRADLGAAVRYTF